MSPTTMQASLPVIILIDDDSFGAKMLEQLIESFSETTMVCHTDPAKALEAIGRQIPDVVITDYDMPGINGIEVIETLRQHPDTSEVPILMLTGIDDPKIRLAALDAGANDFITKPFEGAEVRARVRNMLGLRAGQKSLKERAAFLAAEVAAGIRSVTAREQETILRLARAAEYRDSDTGAHLQRIAEYTGVIARGLMLVPSFQEAIFLAAPMHDIGKIGIPDYILRKPGLLEPAEYAMMQSHASIGHQILEGSRSELLQLAGEIALTHHERWDGSGYPSGLAAEQIPLGGRVVAVADVFDALASKRSYKKAWEIEATLEYIRDNGGAQFDPDCVEAFLQSREEILDIRDRFAD